MAQHTPFHFSNLFDTPILTVKSWFDPKDVKRENSIVIDKKNHKLVYYDKDGKVKQTTSIATGKNPGTKRKEGDLKTPVGNFRIVKYNNDADASYYGNNNFFGLTGGEGIGIHGDAGRPGSIGTNASHGCVRLPNNQIVKLANTIGDNGDWRGMKVYITDEFGSTDPNNPMARAKYDLTKDQLKNVLTVLKLNNYYNSSIDGIYGSNTEKALQTALNNGYTLTSDGTLRKKILGIFNNGGIMSYGSYLEY